VADLFAALGASVVDTDQIAHSLTAPGGSAMPAIVAEFGAEFADASGAMDRAAHARAGVQRCRRRAAGSHFAPALRDAALLQARQPLAAGVIFAVPLLVESGTWRQRVSASSRWTVRRGNWPV
jgi:dephospho-CoA kinase